MRRYPVYKPSGVEWLGEIPHAWNTIKIKFTDTLIMGQSPESKDVTDFEKGLPFLQGNAEFSENHPIPKNWCERANKTAVKDDLLLSVRAPVGALNVSDQTYGIGRGLCAIRAKKNNLRFLYYLLSILKDELNKVSTGTTFVAITIPNLSNVILPKVSLPEQNSIVRFLDHKTGQIDRFIGNRQKQIELLREQLHFKINDAITKGINPKVRLKPTDIKYVPEIPEHWDVRKFKSLTSILTCGVAATPEYVDESEGVPFLSAQNCRPFRMDLSTYNYIKPSLHKQLTKYKKPQRGDVLVTRVGAGIGQACVIDTDLEFSVYVSLTHIRPNKQFLGEYIVYFFNTEYCYQLNHEGTVVAGGQGNLNVQNVERYRIPLPPVEEQIEIIAYLDNYRAEMDTLISKYQKQTELMQEYRTSLISQAVTGKIDVRDWHPKNRKHDTKQLPIAMTSEN